jgi:uncharacterized protein YeaO (DUF488 family)
MPISKLRYTHMTVRIVRLGSARTKGEGLRIGTVRRPPRGVPKAEYSSRDIFDLWFPNLAPSEGLLKQFFPLTDDSQWKSFERRFLAEMKTPGPNRDLDLLAALSHQTDFSIGCYCEDEARCHRVLLRGLLEKRGASLE